MLFSYKNPTERQSIGSESGSSSSRFQPAVTTEDESHHSTYTGLYLFNYGLPMLNHKADLPTAIWMLAAYLNPEVSRADDIRIIVVYIPHLMPAAMRTHPAVMPADSFLVPTPDSIRLFLTPDILDAEREQRQQLDPRLAEYHFCSLIERKPNFIYRDFFPQTIFTV